MTLLPGPRRRILALLRARDRTIPELAQQLAITPNAVRGHLAVLARDGLVASGEARRTEARGKPALLYGLTTAAEELFPRGYGAILFGVMDLLSEWDGPDAPVEVPPLLYVVVERCCLVYRWVVRPVSTRPRRLLIGRV